MLRTMFASGDDGYMQLGLMFNLSDGNAKVRWLGAGIVT